MCLRFIYTFHGRGKRAGDSFILSTDMENMFEAYSYFPRMWKTCWKLIHAFHGCGLSITYIHSCKYSFS
jgi:hypothetical protein